MSRLALKYSKGNVLLLESMQWVEMTDGALGVAGRKNEVPSLSFIICQVISLVI
jgi:hypothetical protein